MLVCASAAVAQPAQVIVFRHAEKPLDDANPHLSVRGQERAAALAWYLDSNLMYTNYGRPVAIFAANPTADAPSQRTVETVTPFAERIAVPIDTTFSAVQFHELASEIATNSNYQGKTVVICWPHDQIPALAHALGVRAVADWKAHDFSHLLVIRYTTNRARMFHIAERLLFGDPAH